MSSATLLKHPVAYMTADGPGAMSNFMGFPQAPIFGPPQYFSRGGRAGDPISPFFIPTNVNQPYTIPEFTGYSPAGQYGNIPYSAESKPVVGEPQEIAVNALLALNPKSTATSPTDISRSPPSTMTSTIRTFSPEEHPAPDLISALRMTTAAYAPGESCMQDAQYPPDVKPVLPMPGYISDGSTTSITSPIMSERSPITKRTKSASKSGNNICQICGKSYARPSTLKTHMRTHSGEKPYRCDVCSKAFTQAANLTAHLRTHSGEKPFSCPICQKRFSQSSSVTTHLRTHSGERPYRCDYCGKAFADTSTLTKHKRIHSGEKPYRCKICNLGFSQSGNLHRHMKTHNN